MHTNKVVQSVVPLGIMLVGIAVAGAILAQDRPNGTPLTGAELQAMFGKGAMVDNYHPAAGWKASFALMASGLAFMHYIQPSDGTGGQDVGTWRIEGDTLCLKWKNRRRGQEQCHRHYRLEPNRYETRLATDTNILTSVYSLRQ